MSRETYETYSAEPEKIDLIAFLAEYFQAFRKFFLGVLILVILMGGGSFLTAKLRYQPMYEAYTSFVVGSNRAVGYSYYDNVTAQQLGKTFPYIVTSGVLKDVVARDLQVGAVTSQIEASVMENTNLFTIRVKDSSPDTAYRVLQSVITNYPEVAEYIIGATTLTVVDDSGVPVSPINSQDAVYAGAVGAVFPPVGFGDKSRAADSAPFPAPPVQEGCGQLPVKGQDSHTEPAAHEGIGNALDAHARLPVV